MSFDSKATTYQWQINRLTQLDREIRLMEAAEAGVLNNAWVTRLLSRARFKAEQRRKTTERNYLAGQMLGINSETIHGQLLA